MIVEFACFIDLTDHIQKETIIGKVAEYRKILAAADVATYFDGVTLVNRIYIHNERARSIYIHESDTCPSLFLYNISVIIHI